MRIGPGAREKEVSAATASTEAIVSPVDAMVGDVGLPARRLRKVVTNACCSGTDRTAGWQRALLAPRPARPAGVPRLPPATRGRRPALPGVPRGAAVAWSGPLPALRAARPVRRSLPGTAAGLRPRLGATRVCRAGAQRGGRPQGAR